MIYSWLFQVHYVLCRYGILPTDRDLPCNPSQAAEGRPAGSKLPMMSGIMNARTMHFTFMFSLELRCVLILSVHQAFGLYTAGVVSAKLNQ